MKNRTDRSDRPPSRGRRGIVVFVAGALALGLGVTGVHALLAGGSPSSGDVRSERRGHPGPAVAPVGVAAFPRPTHTRPSPAAEPTVDPNALADGVYPTYVRAVDVEGATVTVDVLQTFFGEAAHQAAIEDGVHWRDVRYDPVYIRNENPLLRTLPVAPDAHIKLIGVCEAPSRSIGLTQLRDGDHAVHRHLLLRRLGDRRQCRRDPAARRGRGLLSTDRSTDMTQVTVERGTGGDGWRGRAWRSPSPPAWSPRRPPRAGHAGEPAERHPRDPRDR